METGRVKLSTYTTRTVTTAFSLLSSLLLRPLSMKGITTPGIKHPTNTPVEEERPEGMPAIASAVLNVMLI